MCNFVFTMEVQEEGMRVEEEFVTIHSSILTPNFKRHNEDFFNFKLKKYYIVNYTFHFRMFLPPLPSLSSNTFKKFKIV